MKLAVLVVPMLLGPAFFLFTAATAVPTRSSEKDPRQQSASYGDPLPSAKASNGGEWSGAVSPADWDLSKLLEQLDDVSECNRTVSGPLLRKLLERSMGGSHLQFLWLAKLVAEHPHVLNRDLPMNASLSGQPPIRPPNATYAIYSLRLECPKAIALNSVAGQSAPANHPLTPTWTPLLVIPTPITNSFLTVRLPVDSLDVCSFSSCSNKCSWTVHGGLRVYARVCCGSEVERGDDMCRANTDTFRRPLFLWSAICSVVCILLIGVVVRERRQTQNERSGWALMELFLIGAALLYCIPLLDYFSPPSGSCLGFIWLRQIGFATFYGSIVLKIYRNLQEYRVRKAHHVIVKEQDLLKYLSTILVATLTSLIAYTFGAWNDTELWTSAWPQCPPQNWFYAWQVIELLFLLHGMRLCYKARNSSWLERWQFTVAVCLEAVITLMASLITYSIRHSGHSDTLLTVTFVQEQLTVTVSVVIIMAPKFYLVTSESNRRTLTMSGSSGRAHPSLAKLRDNILNGTIDFAEVPIGDMNPDDIRAELKRVYTQLRMYKLRSIYADNPHIPNKTRKGKKSSDKSCKNRRISIPPTSSSPKVRKVDEEDEEKSDLTVESAPHNVYLSTYKLQLEPDHSVRV